MNSTSRLLHVSAILGLMLGFSAGMLQAQDPALRDRIIENHFWFVPEGPGPFPTLIALPGCSGIAFSDPLKEVNHPELAQADRLFRSHYPRAAERLRREGFAVLLVHVHAAEGWITACGGQIAGDLLADYVDESLSWAEELDFVDASRIHLIGWSMGGMGVLAWLGESRRQTVDVRSAIAVYPDCSKAESLTSPVSLLMLLGDDDDIALPSECEELLSRSDTRSMARVHHYPGARHGYDIEDAPPVLEIGDGRTIGYQRAAAEATWMEILEFLGM
jgi:dienelactone hydrolase